MNRMKFVRPEATFDHPLLAPLFDDMLKCEELLEQSDTPFARRTYIRSAFAFIEGSLYWLKEVAQKLVLSSGYQKGNIEIAKLMLLMDQTFKPNKQGKIEESGQNTIPFVNYAAFVIRCIYDAWDVDPSGCFSENGWAQLQNALKVRHRITHPKKAEDLEITEEEVAVTSEGIWWLYNSILGAVGVMSKRHGFEVKPEDIDPGQQDRSVR